MPRPAKWPFQRGEHGAISQQPTVMIREDVIFPLTIPSGDVYPVFQLLLPTILTRTQFRRDGEDEVANLPRSVKGLRCIVFFQRQPHWIPCLDAVGRKVRTMISYLAETVVRVRAEFA